MNAVVIYPTTIVIPKGSHSKYVTHQLVEKGIIKSSSKFHLYLRIRKLDSKIHSGEFEIPENASYQTIANIITGKVPQLISITIPEGKTIIEIASMLEEKRVINKSELFIKYLKSVAVEKTGYSSLFQNIPTRNFEGLLFPNTYKFSKLTPYDTVLKTLLKETSNVLLNEYKKVKSPRLSFYKTLILASIIEKEAGTKSEMSVISGVFHNRLRKNMLLESCATVDYALGGPKKPILSFDDLKFKSPYNTYLNRGLPPSPIAAPGKDAFLAALYPKSTPYLFFVSKNDGSGTHIFSKTYTEHLKNQQLTLAK